MADSDGQAPRDEPQVASLSSTGDRASAAPEAASGEPPSYRQLAQAHLDALAHAAIRRAGGEDEEAEAEAMEGGAAAEPFYAAAARIEAVARRMGWLLPLQELAVRYGLDPVELDALVWAFVQQSRGEGQARPTLGEFLTARCDASAVRNEVMALFRREARLRHWGLLKLMIAPEAVAENLHQRVLSLPEPVHAFLLGERSLGDLLGGVAQMVGGAEGAARGVGRRRVVFPQEAALAGLIQRYIDRLAPGVSASAQESLVVELCGAPRAGATSLTRELARAYGALLIELDGTRLAVCAPQHRLQLVEEVAAALRLYDAWLVIDRVEALSEAEATLEALARVVDRVATVFFVLGRGRSPVTHPLGVRALCHVEVEASEATRHALWRQALEEQAVAPAPEDVRMVAAKFDLSAGQIVNAARHVALGVGAAGAAPSFEALDVSAHEQQRGNLAEVATVRRGRGELGDLVLPEEEKVSLREIIRAARFRTQLLHGWRFAERFNYGTGVVALFSGEPGTGKTFAAEVIAAALELDLFQIAVPQVVSKWVGETEKQISRIFEEAKSSRAVLLFDEADSLFGSRTEVRTASDRYANMATNHLLQAIEAYEGVVILTTNLEENLDAAAERRILFRIRFPFPGAGERAELWRRMLPAGAPLADDIDFEDLGDTFELSGGHIKNAIIRAGYDALERGASLDMATLMAAAEREATMTGRLVRRSGVEYFR